MDFKRLSDLSKAISCDLRVQMSVTRHYALNHYATTHLLVTITLWGNKSFTSSFPVSLSKPKEVTYLTLVPHIRVSLHTILSHSRPWQSFPKMAISGSEIKGHMGRVWKQQKVHNPNRIKSVYLATLRQTHLTSCIIMCTYPVLGTVSQCSVQLLGGPLQLPDPPRVLRIQYLRHS